MFPRFASYMLLLGGLFMTSSRVLGSETVDIATITRVEGRVHILSNPQKDCPPTLKDKKAGSDPSVPSGPAHVLFNGMYYTVEPAAKGARLKMGHVLQTFPDAKARLIYKNGDQITVGPGTAYRVTWGDAEAKSIVDLFFGKMRLMIKKNGPRAGTEIQTNTTVLGVRGTDFHVLGYGKSGGTEVSVILGEVEARRTGQKKSQAVKIPSGFTAVIAPPITPPSAPSPTTTPLTPLVPAGEAQNKAETEKVAPPKESGVPDLGIALEKTTKEQLISIQSESVVKKKKEDPKEALSEETRKEIASLEKEAVKVVLEDIKEHDPKLFTEISKAPPKSLNSDTLSSITVKKQFKEAPSAPKPSKPSAADLDKVGEDAYEKYFKVED